MDIKIETNIKRVVKQLNVIERKQIPFATSVAINETIGTKHTKGLRAVIAREMNKRLDRPKVSTTRVGSPNTGNNALYFLRSGKKNLTATLGFKYWASAFMKFLVFGGTRTTGKNIPIPTPAAKIDKFGNIYRKRGGLVRKKNQFFGKSGQGVFERAKKKDKPKLIIAFKKSVNYKPIFPFYEIAGRYIGFTFPKKFNEALTKALRSAR